MTHLPEADSSIIVSFLTSSLQHIKAGEGVIGSVRSGNRDADVFPDADRFDIHRRIDQGKNLAFGHGPHRCQAEWLSRKEIEVAIGNPLTFLF